MRCPIIALFFTLFCFISCNDNVEYTINNQADLDRLVKNEYIKISFDSSDLDFSDCAIQNFKFENVELLKIKKSDYKQIKDGLLTARLNPMQTVVAGNVSLEYRGLRFCLNHLGEMSRNNRRLQINQELVYLINSQSEFYNSFAKEELEGKDSLISKFGVPFNLQKNNLESSILGKVKISDKEKTEIKQNRRNVILTY